MPEILREFWLPILVATLLLSFIVWGAVRYNSSSGGVSLPSLPKAPKWIWKFLFIGLILFVIGSVLLRQYKSIPRETSYAEEMAELGLEEVRFEDFNWKMTFHGGMTDEGEVSKQGVNEYIVSGPFSDGTENYYKLYRNGSLKGKMTIERGGAHFSGEWEGQRFSGKYFLRRFFDYPVFIGEFTTDGYGGDGIAIMSAVGVEWRYRAKK